VETSLVEEGRAAYGRYCSGCHGISGDGNGEAARFFDPRPRNFQTANFKFSWTRSGSLPTDEDLERTITRGLKGSAMPPFDLLPARTVRALVAYIKTFSPKWQQQSPAPRIPVVEDPYRALADKSTAIARGEKLYHGFATCWTCHPAYVREERINEQIVAFSGLARPGFRPDLMHGTGKPNTEGDLIYPPDFRRDFVRSGADVHSLYRVISAGISGTAMPTWADSIDIPGKHAGDPPLARPEDLWALAYYVQDLIAQRPAKLPAGAFDIRERPKIILPPGQRPVPSAPDTEDEWEDWEESEGTGQ
jgi:mono/diheme cytochrome c family protein